MRVANDSNKMLEVFEVGSMRESKGRPDDAWLPAFGEDSASAIRLVRVVEVKACQWLSHFKDGENGGLESYTI